MPLTIDRDDERRRFVVVASGVLDVGQLIDVANVRVGDERLYGLLFDARQVTSAPPGAQWRDFADRISRHTIRDGRGRVAMLAASDAVYGAFRMFELLCEAGGAPIVRVCRDLAEAVRRGVTAAGGTAPAAVAGGGFGGQGQGRGQGGAQRAQTDSSAGQRGTDSQEYLKKEERQLLLLPQESYREVGPLVEGPGDVYICGECIELC